MKSSGLFLALLVAACPSFAASPIAAAQPASGWAASDTASSRPDDQATLVSAALNRFDSALVSRDLVELQATGIKAGDAKRWHTFFKNNPAASVTDSCPSSALFLSGDTAVWSCTEMATVLSEGKPLTHVQVIRFTFARRNGEWKISDRR